MDLLTTVAQAHGAARAARAAGRRIALVPTMGALHDGHLALVAEARRRADVVVASVFVNPTQFGPTEDFARYPRDADGDAAKLARAGADALFAPSVAEVYPFGAGEGVWVDVGGLDRHLCGPFRPGHFRGVATVVAKLLHACTPDVAVFGLKDVQQFLILRRMARALLWPVEIAGMETVREADGLALSSRNAYLGAAERAQAAVLSRALFEARAAVEGGEQAPEALVEAVRARIATASLARLQYAEVVEAGTLQPVSRLAPGGEIVVALAAYFGTTRLIDNVLARVPDAAPSALAA